MGSVRVMVSQVSRVVLVLVWLQGAWAEQHNFCRPLEDYGPRYDAMEERSVCQTHFHKSCQPVTVSDCMNVTELQCDVNLFTTCSMNWTMKDTVESVMKVSTVDLKNCTKEMVVEYHNKTVYDCRNITKRHCTTLWTVNEQGEKIWAGNEDDCRDVTWEECSPVIKTVPMAVAQMVCDSVPVNYFDYENTTSPRMADSLDCTVDKRVVCNPVTSSKCAEITYTKCEEIPITTCSVVSIPVPSQEKLRKQWCLFDQTENIDFNTEVRKITGDFPETGETLEGSASVLEVYKDIGNRRKIEPIFSDYDFSYVQTINESSGYKKRRQAKVAKSEKKPKLKKKEAHGSQTKKITRVSKNVSVKRH